MSAPQPPIVTQVIKAQSEKLPDDTPILRRSHAMFFTKPQNTNIIKKEKPTDNKTIKN